MAMPKFIANHPERKDYLIALWDEYGNKCRLGHLNCTDLTHYARIKTKVVLSVRKVKFMEYKDSSSKPILDRVGDPCFQKVPEIKRDIVEYPSIGTVYYDDVEAPLTDYDVIKDNLKAIWIKADTAETVDNYRSEYAARHHISDNLPLKGVFKGIASDCYFDKMPVYKVIGFGMDALTFKPFVQIEINTTGTRIFIDLTKVFKSKSTNAKRRIIRYGNNGKIDSDVDFAIWVAVKKYLG